MHIDMTDWPQPTTRDWFSPHQKRSLPYILWVSVDWGFFPWTITAVVIAFMVFVIEVTQTSNVKPDGAGGRSLIALLVSLLFLSILGLRYWIRSRRASFGIEMESKHRREWAQKFLETGPRKQSSWRLRFLLWLRKQPKLTREIARDGIEVEELGSQSNVCSSSLGLPPTQPASDLLRVIQVILAIVELVLMILFKQTLSHQDYSRDLSANFIIFNCIVTPPTTLGIWIELNHYRAGTRGEAGLYRTRASRHLESFVIFIWFIGFLFLMSSMNDQNHHATRMGEASGALAALEWGVFLSH